MTTTAIMFIVLIVFIALLILELSQDRAFLPGLPPFPKKKDVMKSYVISLFFKVVTILMIATFLIINLLEH